MMDESQSFDVAYCEENDVRISNEDWFEISRALEPYHAVFYKVWEMGKPIFNQEIETAAVQFDKNGELIWFHFNPNFWKRLQFKDKIFVICHEALHVVLNHGIRTRDAGSNAQATNVALDIVVNHSLVNNFGFVKSDIEGWQDYCWIDTVFPERKPRPSEHEAYEYYYNLFEKVYGDFGMGDGEGGGPSVLDDHSMMSVDADGDQADWSKAIDGLNSSLSEEEKASLKSVVEKHFKEDPKSSEQQAGTGTGQWTFLNIKKVSHKKKWETVIKKWSKKYFKPKEKDEEQWARIHRRMSLLPRKMFLPSEMEIDERDFEKTRIDVWFFLDTSGSCWNLKDRFFTAAASLPPERFNIRLFCFDTVVKETTLESKKVYGGGGTCFKILEEEIQKEIRQGAEYPTGVFVITDGYGTAVKPEKPQNWYWFLSAKYRTHIPKECNVFNLADYE